MACERFAPGPSMLLHRGFLLLGALLLCDAVGAQAPAFPNRPLRMVVGTPPGSGVDLLSRLLAKALTADLGQPVLVENRPGADGAIGARAGATAAPDGHVLLPATRSQAVLNAVFRRDLGYDPLRDFAPVTFLARQVTVVSVHAGVEARTLREFVDLARARPRLFNYGAGSTTFRFIAEAFLGQVGAEMISVPYNGVPPTVAALSAGDVHLALTDVSTILPAVRAGRVRPLAIIDDHRVEALPGVPTLAEAGFPAMDAPLWLGLFVPAGTPAETIGHLQASVARALGQPGMRRRLQQIGIEPQSTTPEALGALQLSDLARSTELARRLGLAGQ